MTGPFVNDNVPLGARGIARYFGYAHCGLIDHFKVRDYKPRLAEAVRLSLWIPLTRDIPIAWVLFFGAAGVITILYMSRYAENAYFLPFLTVFSPVWPFVSFSFWLSAAFSHGRQTVRSGFAPAEKPPKGNLNLHPEPCGALFLCT